MGRQPSGKGESRTMRRWRVGTFSMGLSLILVGITLLLSAWQGLSAFDALIGWWPVTFILLGLEVLVFIAFAKKEQPVLHYDIFSILLVGVLCCFCMAFALVTSTGVMNEIRYAIGSVERTADLPEIQEPVPQGIERIVVQSSGFMPKIDKATGRELHLFGNYRTRTTDQEPAISLKKEEVATIHTIGTTIYIAVKQLSHRSGIIQVYPFATMTLTLPQDIPFEMRGSDNQLVKITE
jgi:hypothetical protein